ncbi:MAG: endonuclease domain-containing protein [Chloroflexi bacterium]|nr:endonuclease domain-containing protein [Chloroflexota bacterium]
MLRRGQTDAERRLWSRLRRKQLDGFNFRRQQPVGPCVADFVCFEKKLIVELDGSQHDEGREKDEEKTAWLNKGGFTVIRFWNNDVFGNLEGVWEVIEEALNSPSPGLSHRERGNVEL